jgi:hypothetical protein
MPEQNGCRLTSNRPAVKSNPIAAAALRARALGGRRVRPLENVRPHRPARFGDPPGQLDQRVPQRNEHLGHGGGGLARLELVQQRVVRVGLKTDAIRFLPLEAQRLGQPRFERRKI